MPDETDDQEKMATLGRRGSRARWGTRSRTADTALAALESLRKRLEPDQRERLHKLADEDRDSA